MVVFINKSLGQRLILERIVEIIKMHIWDPYWSSMEHTVGYVKSALETNLDSPYTEKPAMMKKYFALKHKTHSMSNLPKSNAGLSISFIIFFLVPLSSLVKNFTINLAFILQGIGVTLLIFQ